MAQGESVVANMVKHDNIRLTLRTIFMQVVRTSIEDNKGMNDAKTIRLLEEFLVKNENHGRLKKSVLRKIIRLRRVGSANLD